MSNTQTFQSAHSPENVRVVKAGVDTIDETGPWHGLEVPAAPDFRNYPEGMSETDRQVEYAIRRGQDHLHRAVANTEHGLDPLAPATWYEPQNDVDPSECMTTEAIKKWQSIEDLDERALAAYGPWLYHSANEHLDDPHRKRFSWKWARYLSDRGVPAYDAAVDGIMSCLDADDALTKVPFLPPVHKSAWTDGLIIPRRGIHTLALEQLYTGYQMKPGNLKPVTKNTPNGDKVLKVLSRKEEVTDVHVPARSRWLIEQAGGVHLTKPITVVLTEGAAEAMGIAAAGTPAISAAGVDMLLTNVKRTIDADNTEDVLDSDGYKIKVLTPTLLALVEEWKKNKCLHLVQFAVLFDSDARTNEQVGRAGRSVVWALRKHGAKAELFFAPEVHGIDKAGAGDFLASGASWDELAAKLHHEQIGKAVATAITGQIMKSADEVDWNSPKDVIEFAKANALTPDNIPWEKVGGREVWQMPATTPLQVSEWWARTLAANYLVTEMDNLFYQYDGVKFVKSNQAKGLIRAASEFLKVAGALSDAAMGPTETTLTEDVIGDDGKPVKDENGVPVVRSEVQLTWPSSFLRQYEEGSKNGYLTRFMKAEPSLSIHDTALDSRGDILVFGNGCYDHSTGEFRGNRPEDLATKWMQCDYDPDAAHPVWESCLDIWGGRGSELERYMQLVIAESFLRRLPSDKKLRFIKGESDAAKSFMFVTLAKCFESYVSKFPKVLLAGDIGSNSTQFAYAKLGHAALTYCEELEDGSSMHLTTIKDLYSGSKIDARSPGGNWMELYPTWSVWALVNELPTLLGTIDGSIEKRLEVIIAPNRYGTAEDVARGTHNKLMDPGIEGRRDREIDNIRPAAAAWIIEGLRRLRDEYDDNLYKKNAEPASVKQATKQYLEGGDQVGRFIQEALQPGTWVNSDSDDLRYEASLPDLYARYKEWRRLTYGENSRGELNQNNLGIRMEAHMLFTGRGITRKKLTPVEVTRSGEIIGQKSQRRAFAGVRIAVNGGSGWDGSEVVDPTPKQIAAWKMHREF